MHNGLHSHHEIHISQLSQFVVLTTNVTVGEEGWWMSTRFKKKKKVISITLHYTELTNKIISPEHPIRSSSVDEIVDFLT